jgi:hypothetical protein
MLKRTFLSLIAVASLSFTVPAIAQTETPTSEATMQLPTPSKSGYAPVNGVEVYYAVYGEGDPLVLLHGGLATMDMFGPNVALLTEGHQVIAVNRHRTLTLDRRGKLALTQSR